MYRILPDDCLVIYLTAPLSESSTKDYVGALLYIRNGGATRRIYSPSYSVISSRQLFQTCDTAD